MATGAGRAADAAETAEGETLIFSQHLACPVCGTSYDELAPRNFSFNSPYGACPSCDGLGTRYEVDPELVVPDPDLSIDEGAVAPWAGARNEYFGRLLQGVAETFGIPTSVPWRKLKKQDQKVDPVRVGHGPGPPALQEPLWPHAFLLHDL